MTKSKKVSTAYPEINQTLSELHQRAESILLDNFVGMYLYGSLAMDSFQPIRSDIDFVVIVFEPLDNGTINALETMHQELLITENKWVKKLEGAYIPKHVIRGRSDNHAEVPTLNEGNFYLARLGSDWDIHRYVLREYEAIISGPSPRDFIDPVSIDQIKLAIREVLDNWWLPMLEDPARLERPGYQPFAVLSMCRTLHTLNTGTLASKSDAANWAIEMLDEDWVRLIRQALKWGEGDEIESIEQTIAFMRYAIDMCRKN